MSTATFLRAYQKITKTSPPEEEPTEPVKSESETISAFVNWHKNVFGPFINKFQLGGIINPESKLEEEKKINEVRMAQERKQQMFTKQSAASLQERIAALSPEEKERIESVKDADMIAWFNRTKVSEQDKQLRTIPGAFYKVRAQGSVSSQDSDEISKFYKRCFTTVGLLFFHSWTVVHFLYESRIFYKGRTPQPIYLNFVYVWYPACLAGVFFYMISENNRLLRQLDSKYTPIWVRITEQQRL